MKKRVLAVLLAVCLVAVLVPLRAEASGTCGEAVTWYLQNGVLTLEGTGATWAYVGFNTPPWWTAPTKRIHTVVVGEGITAIGAGLFMGESKLEEVKLPSTLQAIGSECFSDCENLKRIEIPSSVTTIGNSAFHWCASLESIVIPDSVTSLGGGIFGSCTALESVKLPGGLTAIGGSMFSGCTSLKRVELPDGVTSIGSYAFYNCESLTTISISGKVTQIGEYALEGCISLDGIWVDSGNPNYVSDEKGVLYDKGKTRILAVPGKLAGSYTVPDTVTKIDGYAFRNCTRLTELILPAGLTELSYHMCEGCTALERVVLGENVTELNKETFLNCSSLKEINIPGGVTQLQYGLFRGCGALKTLTLPEGITTIGEYAFADCSALESINFPSSLTKIDNHAFQSCAALKEAKLPEGLKTIGWNTFSGCDSLTQVEIPASVTSIDEFAFAGCDSLEGFRVSPESKSYVHDDRGVLYNKKMTVLVAAPNKLSGSYTVPQGVTSIYGGAFSGSAISEILLPDTLTNLGWKTFTSCQGLTEVTIPDSVKEIGMYSFSNCQNLEQVTLSASLEEINEGTFYQCTGLKRIDSPVSVGNIWNEAFKGCANLEEVTFAESVKELDLAVEVFYDCDKLTRVVLPEGTGEIWYGAFACCDSLREVTIPGSVYYLDEAVFYQCGALEDVYFRDTEARLRQVMKPALNSDAIRVLRFDYAPACAEGEHIAINDSAVEVTCTADGLTEGSHCGVCGTVMVKQEGIPATGHSWDGGEQTKAPTETEPGIMTYTCIRCGETRTEEFTAHVHVYAKAYSLPSCTERGYTYYFCACGHSYNDDFVDALGHEWDEGKVVVPATESSAGLMLYTCIREGCGVNSTVEIPKLDHVHRYEAAVTEPSCTEGGYTTHTCACGDSYTDSETAPSGHMYLGGACMTCGAKDPDWTEPTEPEKPVEPVLPWGVQRLAGDNRYETAFWAAEQMRVALRLEKFDAVVVASGTTFADALSGSYLAAVKDAPILLACNVDWVNELVKTYIRDNLNPGGTVYILGGTGAVPASFEKGLDGFAVRRLAGANRFLTNLMVLEEAGVGDKSILVCTGLGFADSLSASAAKLPILLVYGDKLMSEQAAFMESLRGNPMYVIGGDGAVSEKMEAALNGYGEVSRLAGGNRFETSVLIAETFFRNPKAAVLAYAWDFPDGLCGGPLAAAMNAPLILTMAKYEGQAAGYIQGKEIRSAVVLGGEKLIPEASVNLIFN